jgi:hypothetical protein
MLPIWNPLILAANIIHYPIQRFILAVSISHTNSTNILQRNITRRHASKKNESLYHFLTKHQQQNINMHVFLPYTSATKFKNQRKIRHILYLGSCFRICDQSKQMEIEVNMFEN